MVDRVRTYRDLDLNLTKHPVTKDVAAVVGDRAVITAVKNLIYTSFYERPFQPGLGSSVRQFLFENVTPLTLQHLKTAIEEVVENYEPRAKLSNVVCDFIPDENRFKVSIRMYIQNKIDPVTVTMFLKRVR